MFPSTKIYIFNVNCLIIGGECSIALSQVDPRDKWLKNVVLLIFDFTFKLH